MKSDDVQLLYVLGCCQMRLRWSMGSINLERSLFNILILGMFQHHAKTLTMRLHMGCGRCGAFCAGACVRTDCSSINIGAH